MAPLLFSGGLFAHAKPRKDGIEKRFVAIEAQNRLQVPAGSSKLQTNQFSALARYEQFMCSAECIQ